MPIETQPVVPAEDGAVAAFPDREVDRSGGPRREWDRHDLAALAQDRQRPVPTLETQRFDVSPGRFGDS